MSNLAGIRHISVDDYLAGEAESPVKREYAGGEIFAEDVGLTPAENTADWRGQKNVPSMGDDADAKRLAAMRPAR